MTVEVTRDEILRGTLILRQPKRGYRFAIDPLLLVEFVIKGRKRTLGRVADFGTGSGVVALAVARRDVRAHVTALELQPRLRGIAEQNVMDNQLADRVRVVEADICDAAAMRKAVRGGAFDWVLSNPPFRPLGEGDANASEEATIARHELKMTLDGWCREMKRVLGPAGRVALIYPAERVQRLLTALDAQALRPLRVRPVYPRAGEPATRVLVEAQKGARGNLVIEPPWYVLGEDGKYTDDTERALCGQSSTP
jgi:tRNA1Val (adenine37-N6)-methyltransferase